MHLKGRQAHPMESIMSDKIMVTLKEACQMLSLSRSSVYRLIDQGKLVPKKMGSRTLFLVTEIEVFAQSL